MSTKFLHIITSKNRGMQLDAQLSTLDFIKGNVETKVIYKATTEKHKEVYEALLLKYSNKVTFIKEKNYKEDLENTILNCNCNYVFVTPDDGVFLREIDFDNLGSQIQSTNCIFSLRLGTHLKVCHPLNNINQPLPKFEICGSLLLWKWGEGKLDWAYPLALDGSIFPKDLFIKMISAIPYDKPTSLEVNLQKYVPIFSTSLGGCYKDSSFVSIPWNAVTDQATNKNSGISENLFLDKWLEGSVIDLSNIIGTYPASCHYEYALHFINK